LSLSVSNFPSSIGPLSRGLLSRFEERSLVAR
jgi:hypothetical protein